MGMQYLFQSGFKLLFTECSSWLLSKLQADTGCSPASHRCSLESEWLCMKSKPVVFWSHWICCAGTGGFYSMCVASLRLSRRDLCITSDECRYISKISDSTQTKATGRQRMGLVKPRLFGSLLLSLVKSHGFLNGAKIYPLNFPCFVVVIFLIKK